MAEKENHFNDWPNTQGFDVRYQETKPTELQVTGNIPAYTAGVLFRNGVGPREVKTDKKTTFKVNHWFDNLAQVHRFQIISPDAQHSTVRVIHNSRLTSDGLVERIIQTGEREGFTFAAKYDPCMSFFQKLQSFFRSSPEIRPNGVNVGVTLSTNYPGISSKGTKFEKPHDQEKLNTLCNKTDNSLVQMLDPETLEPIGIARQTVLHESLKGPMSAAHAKTCPITGDVYNYNLQPGRSGTYRVFKVSAATGKTSILATCQAPASYIHSMFMTENYLILAVWNAYYRAGGAAMLWTKNLLDAMQDFDSSKPTTWFVIDRKSPEEGGKGVVATYESAPFFCFHSINAYETPSASDPSKTDIIADACAYDGLEVLKRFYIDNLMSNSPTAKPYSQHKEAKAAFRRFKLPGLPSTPNTTPLQAEVMFSEEKGLAPELPTMANDLRGKKYRYTYGVTDTGKSTFFDGIIKYDADTREHKIWSVFGQSAGEPIFVPDPDSRDEDGGVLLSVVLDGISGKSYLLVLNAKTLEEVGRATVDGVVGFGFHGTHWPERKDIKPTL